MTALKKIFFICAFIVFIQMLSCNAANSLRRNNPVLNDKDEKFLLIFFSACKSMYLS